MPKSYLTTIPTTHILPRDISIKENVDVIISGITQSGKTSLVFDYLKNIDKQFVYVDFDLFQNIEIGLDKVEQILKKEDIKVLVLDIYDLGILEHLNKFIDRGFQIIIISWSMFKFEKFENINMFPLNFEEFISFKSGVENIEHSFLRYSQTGGFPIFAKYSDEFLFKQVKRLLYFALSEFEINVLKNIAEYSGNARTVLNIYSSLKRTRKISKDKLYKSFDKLVGIGYIISIVEHEKNINKRFYLIDHALQNSFESERNFSRLFENMVISELWKRKKIGCFYKRIDFFIDDEKKAILSLPFIAIETLKRRISKNILDIKHLGTEKIEVITMDLETTFTFQDIEIEAIKFSRWALLN